MHEVSIVQQIVGSLDAELTEIEQSTVRNIIIHVGELSNIQPILLVNAFEAFQLSDHKYVQAKLTVEQIPVEIECPQCLKISNVKNYIFRCKFCDTPTAKIVRGDELLIHKLEF